MFSGNLKFSDNDDFSVDIENYSTHTNLSTIFGVSSQDSSSLKSENPSLKYVPPKSGDGKQQQQQNSKESNLKKPSEWSIVIAKVVSAFKLLNQENISQGKLGLTVLKNPDNQRKIILYRSKTNILSTTTLTDDVKFYVKNSYLQFKDDLQGFWSVLFDQKNDIIAVVELIKDRIVEEEKQQETKEPTPLPSSSQAKNKNSEIRKDNENSITEVVQPTTNDDRATKTSASVDVTASTTSDQSDSSDAELINNKSFPSKPLVPLRKPKSSPQLVTFAHSQQTISPMMNSINTVASYASSSLIPSVDANFVNMLMTENRTQNTEVRMNISKLETKIEKVLDKIESIQHGINNSGEKDGKQKEDLIIELEEKLLEYKKENRKLRLQLDELEEGSKCRDENQLKKSIDAKDLIEFKSLLETLHLNLKDFSTTEDVFKEMIRKLENENFSIKSLLVEEEAKVGQYTIEVEKLKMENEEKQNKFVEENLLLKNQIAELESKVKSLEQINHELKEGKNDLTEKLMNSAFEIDNFKKDKIDLQNKVDQTKLESQKIIESMVKEIMNNLYQVLVSRFETKKSFSTEEILKTCATSIKQETNNAIKKTK